MQDIDGNQLAVGDAYEIVGRNRAPFRYGVISAIETRTDVMRKYHAKCQLLYSAVCPACGSIWMASDATNKWSHSGCAIRKITPLDDERVDETERELIES